MWTAHPCIYLWFVEPVFSAVTTRRVGRSFERRCVFIAMALLSCRLLMRPPLLLRRRLATQVVAVADGWPVLVQERHARETLGGERGPPTANSFHGGTDLTGVRVWEAAPDLIKYIDIHRARLLEGRSVIDLGSGTGAVGLSAAAFGAGHVVLSDIDSKATFATENGWEERTTLAALAENAALNGSRAAAVSVAELRWGLP
jgi:hypothetical protein